MASTASSASDRSHTAWWRPPARWAWWEVLLVAALAAGGAWLRLRSLDRVPLITDDADELAFAWAGLTLILKHVPTSWSYFHAYGGHAVLAANGTYYPIVRPWFDHPPLFALVEGFAAYLSGARALADVSALPIRLPAVALDGVSIVLAAVLGRRTVGRIPGLAGAALLALTPAAALTGRVAESEVLLAPLLLGGLICVHRLLSGEGGRWTGAALVLCCFLAPLAKVPGVVVAGACAAVLIPAGRWRWGLAAVAAGAVALCVYVLYGALIDWRVFTAVFAEQASRRSGVGAAIELIVAQAGINRPLTDGWWLLGWIGAGLALRERASPAAKLLVLPAAVYAALMLLMADQALVARYGWYRETIVPEVYLVAGRLVWEAVRRPSAAVLGLILITGGASATTFWLGAPWKPSTLVLVLILAVALAPAAVAALRPGSRWNPASRVITGLVMAALMTGNVVECWNLDHIYRLL